MTRLGALTLAFLMVTSCLRAEPASDEEWLRAHKIGTDGPSLVEFFRRRTLGEDEVRVIEGLVRRLGHRSFAERERATEALLKWGGAAKPFLRTALTGNDLEAVRRAQRCLEALDQSAGPVLPATAARVLARRAPPTAIATLVAFAPFADDESVEEAVLEALVVLAPSDRKVDPALQKALSDPSAVRRAAAAHVLGRHKEAPVKAEVRPLLRDRDIRVRFRAAQALLIGRERSALPVLTALLGEAPLGWAWQVEELLFRLAGELAPAATLGDGSPEARQKCRVAWEQWRDRHGARVDLSRLQDGQALLGLTLGIEYNTNRVWECNPDGTFRWEITNVRGPMEAWVLPGNRVLIADDSSVTERDFKGNVLWRLEGASGSNGCQRLPNGNTFVSTYSSVMEFGRDGRRLYQHSIAGSNAIRKHRNGNIVYTTDRAIVEISTSGREARRVTLPQGFWVGIEDLPGDRFVVADSNTGRVLEINAQGKVVWEAKVPTACGVTRLPNGHTLVAASSRVVEVDRAGKIVWEKSVPGYARRVHRR